MVENLLQESVSYIQSKSSLKPALGIILGTGFNDFIKNIKIETEIPFDEIPHFDLKTQETSNGRFILGYVRNRPIVILQGRVHYYEGYPMEKVVYPTRTLAMLGIETLVLTNASGGLHEQMQAGDFFIIKDHINLMGVNPLMGNGLKDLGPRFPDMSEPYDLQLVSKLEFLMKKHNLPYHTGVYCGVIGPIFETPAEVRFLKIIGADSVGMSTVPESLAANHLGLRVAGICCITNKASGLSSNKLSLDSVQKTVGSVQTQFYKLMEDFIESVVPLHEENSY